MKQIIDKILTEWSYRVHDGMPNPKNVQHIKNQLVPSKDHDGLYYEILEKK